LDYHTEGDGFWNGLLRGLELFGTGLVVGDHLILIVSDDFLTIPVGLDHLLVVAAALDRAPRLDLLGHVYENLLLAPGVGVFELPEVALEEGDVFDGLCETPHSYLLVVLLLVALADLLDLFLADPEQGFAGPGNLDFRSAVCCV
jgi:hypothetical protein